MIPSRFMVGLLCFGMMSGCEMLGDLGSMLTGDDSSTDVATPEEKGGASKKATNPLDDAIAAQEEYVYNPIGRRDPFRSFIQKEVVVNHDGGALGPLQLHEIDSYKLTGIVSNPSAPHALVRDPDGTGHVVELGTLVGRNWGKVTEIKSSEIVITEEYRDPIENELIIHEVKMALEDVSD